MPSSACDWSSDVCSSDRSEEHTSELQSRSDLVCRLLLEKKKQTSAISAADHTCGLQVRRDPRCPRLPPSENSPPTQPPAPGSYIRPWCPPHGVARTHTLDH